MRKILLSIIILLLIAFGFTAVKNGFKIGNFQILSVAQIDEKNNELDSEIEKVNTLNDTEYPNKINELKTASNNMNNAKSEYLKFTSLSTNEEILEAMQARKYEIEFLWTKLGTHARQQGVVLKFEIVSSSLGANNVNDIKFTVDGTYTAITNFVYAIENDTDLNFRPENFKMVPYTSDIILQATFNVKNVIVDGNSSSKTVNTTQNNNTNNTNNTDSANKQNNNNTTTENTNTVQKQEETNEQTNTDTNTTT